MWVMIEGWGGDEGEARERRMATSRVKEVRVRMFSFVVSFDLDVQGGRKDLSELDVLITEKREALTST
jgi:hypothetical protein